MTTPRSKLRRLPLLHEVIREAAVRCPMARALGCGVSGRCPMKIQEVEAGVTLYAEGEAASRVWYVMSGAVGLLRAAGEHRGVGVPWATRREGHLVGDEALLQEEYADTAKTLSVTTLCAAESVALRRCAYEGNADAARALMEMVLHTHCASSLRPSSAEGTAVRRLARWLVEECRGGLAPGLPRATIAGMLGMLPETLSRALAALATRGAITVTRKEIRVVDAAKLLDAV